MAVALALLSSLIWGTADFLGGTAARRIPTRSVVFVAQLAGLVLLLPLALTVGTSPPSPWPGLLAGVAGAAGIAAFYAALAQGTMGVVAPIAATGVIVPVAVALLRGEAPTVLQTAGMLVAIAGVVLASGPEFSAGASLRPLVLAGVAALAFGTVFVLLADGSEGGPRSVIVMLLLMRIASVGATVPVLAVRGVGGDLRRHLPLLVAVGALDVAANACFAFATRSGLLSVVAVLGSLYPVVTVILAREIHGERLQRVQVIGACSTLAGVALLAAG